MDSGTIDKVAEATKSLADTSGKLVDACQTFAGVVKGPVEDIVGMVQDRLRFARWTRQLALIEKAHTIMQLGVSLHHPEIYRSTSQCRS